MVNNYALVIYRPHSRSVVLNRLSSSDPFMSIKPDEVIQVEYGQGRCDRLVVTAVEHHLVDRPTPGGMFGSTCHELHLYTRAAV